MTGSERLVRLGETAEVGEGVGTELVKDTRDELGELFGLTTAGDGEGVGAEGALDWGQRCVCGRLCGMCPVFPES